MDLVIRATVIYLFLLVLLRLTGKRTVAQLTAFDTVLLIVIAEATDNSIIGEDHSLVSSLVVIVTFAVWEIIFSLLKQKSTRIDEWLEGNPLVIVDHGHMLTNRTDKEKIDEDDILSAARRLRGIEKLSDVKYAVLEKNGTISIIPLKNVHT